MYECFIKILVNGNQWSNILDEIDWDSYDELGDLDSGETALVFYKKSVDLEQAQYLANSLTQKLNKYGPTEIKIVQIIQDWS